MRTMRSWTTYALGALLATAAATTVSSSPVSADEPNGARSSRSVAVKWEESFGALDLDAAFQGPSPIVCATPASRSLHKRRVRVASWLGLKGEGPLTFTYNIVYSTDDGVTWQPLNNEFTTPRASVGAPLRWAHSTNLALIDLAAGWSYRFGLEVFRGDGFAEGDTADALEGDCEILVERIEDRLKGLR